jgi:drug/metabolite transporter (DMT)-like permease
MRPTDFLILMLCCLGWGGNFVVSAWALGNNPVPPFMLATVRASIVLICMSLFLFRPLPKKFGTLLCVCLAVGAVHLGFLYTGLQTAPASGSSIVSQMLIPMATLMSVIFLKERIGWVRGLAIVAAFFGVCFMIFEPEALSFDIGLIYIFMAYVSLAIGSVLMKKVGNVDWRVYVAWMAVTVFLFCGIASLLFETGQRAVVFNNPIPLFVAAIYAAVIVSIFAHGQYFKLLQTYDVSVVVPLTLMVTVFATVLGVVFLDETLYPRYIIGAVIILPCVYIIAKRQHNREPVPEVIE